MALRHGTYNIEIEVSKHSVLIFYYMMHAMLLPIDFVDFENGHALCRPCSSLLFARYPTREKHFAPPLLQLLARNFAAQGAIKPQLRGRCVAQQLLLRLARGRRRWIALAQLV